jgi:hypothetical protein
MIQGMTPAFHAAKAAVVSSAPQALRFVGMVATATGVSYCSWKFNQQILDPMVESVTGKWSDWLAARSERRSATDAARFKRTIDREINRRVAAGELEPKTFHAGGGAAAGYRRAETTAAEASRQGETVLAEHEE